MFIVRGTMACCKRLRGPFLDSGLIRDKQLVNRNSKPEATFPLELPDPTRPDQKKRAADEVQFHRGNSHSEPLKTEYFYSQTISPSCRCSP